MTTDPRRLLLPAVGLVLALSAAFGCGRGRDQGPAEETPVTRVDVFAAGAEGYPNFRIPSLLATRAGTVLAFAEGREWRSDHAENDIVLKRSTDGGRTWKPLQVVDQDGRNCLNNPEAVQLPSGRILLFYQIYPADVHGVRMAGGIEVASPGISGPSVERAFLVTSDDVGRTWSSRRDITAGVKRPRRIVSIASGPGIGIVLRRGTHRGRIIMPFNESYYAGDPAAGDRRFNVYAAFSDDDGETWRYGQPAPADQNLPGQEGWGNEVQMAELIDGSILLNSRSARGKKLRKTAISKDGGETWSPLVDDPLLPEPQCMGSLFRYSDPLDGEPSVLLFSDPASQSARRRGVVRASYDEGATWPASRVLVPEGQFAYSCLTRLPDGRVGCLYETDDYNRIVMAAFPIAWLEAGRAE